MANEGLGWDPRTKKHNNPGGDWNPGQGENPSYTLPNKTNSLPLKIGHLKRKQSSSNHPFSGAKMFVSGRANGVTWGIRPPAPPTRGVIFLNPGETHLK